MPIRLNVPYVTQLDMGGDPNADDPTGCWYASVCMIGYYFEAGPRQGLPELYARNLGAGRTGHFATGSPQANAALANHHEVLARREHLSPVAHCAEAYTYTIDEIEQLLRAHGPIFMYWMKTDGGQTYGHASVIFGTDATGIIYHDPEKAPNSRMSIANFNSKRQTWRYALMQRA
ncbi:MAG: papain-like cysteine protease family protein [Zavarzinia sp.]|nr:papain-like cysteine protease family protein [Zavarzinia sp.]